MKNKAEQDLFTPYPPPLGQRHQQMKTRNWQGGFRQSGTIGVKKRTEQRPNQSGPSPSRSRLTQHPKNHSKCQAHSQTSNTRGTRHGSWRT